MSTGGRSCPCHSGLAFESCCAPYIRGDREAPDPVALMRSRYSAFATGEAEYLYRTMHEDHEGRAEAREAALRAVRWGRTSRRYAGLVILDQRRKGGSAEVLFHATITERGTDLSFVELSDFAHDGKGWRYLSGITVPLGELGKGPEGLTIDAFLALAAPGS